jgi:hypothetical protein
MTTTPKPALPKPIWTAKGPRPYGDAYSADQMLTYADQCTAAAQARIDALTKDLRFVERWAVHHGSKSRITPQEVLSTIQHYPPIKDITRSYADGVVPETFDPWARIAELEKALKRLLLMARTSGGTAGPDIALMAACDAASAVLASTSGAEPKPWPQEVQHDGSVWPVDPDDIASPPAAELKALSEDEIGALLEKAGWPQVMLSDFVREKLFVLVRLAERAIHANGAPNV